MFGIAEDALLGNGIVNCPVTCVTGEAALATGHIAEARRMGDHIGKASIIAPPASRRFMGALPIAWDPPSD